WLVSDLKLSGTHVADCEKKIESDAPRCDGQPATVMVVACRHRAINHLLFDQAICLPVVRIAYHFGQKVVLAEVTEYIGQINKRMTVKVRLQRESHKSALRPALSFYPQGIIAGNLPSAGQLEQQPIATRSGVYNAYAVAFAFRYPQRALVAIYDRPWISQTRCDDAPLSKHLLPVNTSTQVYDSKQQYDRSSHILQGKIPF